MAFHASTQYRNCYDCHLGKRATAKPSFILGLNPDERAKERGVSDEDIARAVATSDMVKQVAAHNVMGLANGYLGSNKASSETAPEKKATCCGPATATGENSGEPAVKVSSSAKCCG